MRSSDNRAKASEAYCFEVNDLEARCQTKLGVNGY